MIILPTIALTFRVWSRLTSKNPRCWWDDWFAIASLVCAPRYPDHQWFVPDSLTCRKPCVLATLCIQLLWASDGLGRHVNQLTPDQVALGLKYFYAANCPYAVGVSLPKYSAIFFYVRVLKINSTLYRICVYIAIGLITAWPIFAFSATIFQCTPMRKAWIPSVPGHCVNHYSRLLGSAISSVLIDFYIMFLPLPILWTLHTGRSRKLVWTGFFFCTYW